MSSQLASVLAVTSVDSVSMPLLVQWLSDVG